MVSTEARESIPDTSSSVPVASAADSSANNVSSAPEEPKSAEPESGSVPSLSELRTALEAVDEGIDSALNSAASSFWNFASLVGESVSASVGRGGPLEGLGKGLEQGLDGSRKGIERLGKGVEGIMDSIDHWVEEGISQRRREEPVVMPRGHLRRFQERVEALRGNVQTFLEPVEEEGFKEWMKGFSVDDVDLECMEILNQHELIATFYERAVPQMVQEEVFWGRYFWRKYRLEAEERRRMKLLEGAEDEAAESLQGWGDDWDTEDEDDEHGQTHEDKQIIQSASASEDQKLNAPEKESSARTDHGEDEKPLQESRKHGAKTNDLDTQGGDESAGSRSNKGSGLEVKDEESFGKSLKEEGSYVDGTKSTDKQANAGKLEADDEFAEGDWDDDWE